MHKLFLRIILLALSACGDGGSDAVNTSITAAATTHWYRIFAKNTNGTSIGSSVISVVAK